MPLRYMWKEGNGIHPAVQQVRIVWTRVAANSVCSHDRGGSFLKLSQRAVARMALYLAKYSYKCHISQTKQTRPQGSRYFHTDLSVCPEDSGGTQIWQMYHNCNPEH